jgi:ADP-heptose:LPS heptosyltransferase
MRSLFKNIASNITNSILSFFNIYIIYRIGHAVGDQLCMTSVIRLINEQHPFKIVVISSFSELFHNNPRIWKNYEVKVSFVGSLIARILKCLSGKCIENFLFTSKKEVYEDYMRENKSLLHLVEVNTLHFKIDLNFDQISNEIFLSENEINMFSKKFNLHEPYSVIQPNTKTSYTPNKEWGFEKYQKIVTKLQDINWVQVGLEGDLILNGVENVTGKTSLRELAFIIKNANFVIADEGLFNHMASSVGSISYVVYSGFHPIEISKYEKTISIVNNPQVECSPCWITEACPKKNKYCTEQISIEQVINEIKQ